MQNADANRGWAIGGGVRRKGFTPLALLLLRLHFAFSMLHCAVSPVSAQLLLDRVMIRVDGYAITLTDVRAAIAFGLVASPAGVDEAAALAGAVQQLVDRRLLLNEVARFPPPEPSAAAVEAEVAASKARAGSG